MEMSPISKSCMDTVEFKAMIREARKSQMSDTLKKIDQLNNLQGEIINEVLRNTSNLYRRKKLQALKNARKSLQIQN